MLETHLWQSETGSSENPKGLLNSGQLNEQGNTGHARNRQEGV